MATLRKRFGKWEVRVRRCSNKTLSKTFLEKADADKWAREAEVKIEKGFYRLYVIFSTFLSICVGFVFYAEYDLFNGIVVGVILWVALILFGNFIGWLFKGFKK
jgi:lipopolysaccharide export LptBFGC system permease protein LptF